MNVPLSGGDTGLDHAQVGVVDILLLVIFQNHTLDLDTEQFAYQKTSNEVELHRLSEVFFHPRKNISYV